jgi:hypothetical protein
MRIATPILLISILLSVSGATAIAQGNSRRTSTGSPEDLVAALYKAHDSHHSPFFQRKSRALVDKYFDRSLADLIWKDTKGSKGEVGALDGDPLYDAQDMEIKAFKISRIQRANIPANKAEVEVSFTNFGEKKSLIILLTSVNSVWKISDIKYGEGVHLIGLLKGQS